MSTSFILACNIYCKRKECAFYSKLIVKPNGFIYIYTTKGTSSHIITHYAYKSARPIRGSERQEIKELIAKGVKPRQIYFEKRKRRTQEEKRSFNCDNFGTSIRTLKTIQSEFKSRLYNSKNENEAINTIYQKWFEKLSEVKVLPGAIQFVSTTPSLIVIV
ncbi:unnamed protein product [Didymodactylos carnosus]|uniref:Uncharacterized protein n=1 Tax=Didymodactylos carnosus TaxID=1234261 RepID=A0A814LDV1_9BILA|nr:unnamed protein product [Didymodactylos carnosus]CAF1063848.1 unnamed protein product [Didymodactylos carnosus]CAF3713014.1 unnamed protein product [Didymodactylos carnosus]CAF3831866.1 unnamed protein product [Didymodactylos carnosus]